MSELTDISRLRRLTYRDLRSIAIAMKLPGNIKKQYMIELIDAHERSDLQKKEEVMQLVTEDRRARQLTLQAKKEEKMFAEMSQPGVTVGRPRRNFQYSFTKFIASSSQKIGRYTLYEEQELITKRRPSVIQRTVKKEKIVKEEKLKDKVTLPRNHFLWPPIQLLPQIASDSDGQEGELPRKERQSVYDTWPRSPTKQPYSPVCEPVSPELESQLSQTSTNNVTYDNMTHVPTYPNVPTPYMRPAHRSINPMAYYASSQSSLEAGYSASNTVGSQLTTVSSYDTQPRGVVEHLKIHNYEQYMNETKVNTVENTNNSQAQTTEHSGVDKRPHATGYRGHADQWYCPDALPENYSSTTEEQKLTETLYKYGSLNYLNQTLPHSDKPLMLMKYLQEGEPNKEEKYNSLCQYSQSYAKKTHTATKYEDDSQSEDFSGSSTETARQNDVEKYHLEENEAPYNYVKNYEQVETDTLNKCSSNLLEPYVEDDNYAVRSSSTSNDNCYETNSRDLVENKTGAEGRGSSVSKVCEETYSTVDGLENESNSGSLYISVQDEDPAFEEIQHESMTRQIALKGEETTTTAGQNKSHVKYLESCEAERNTFRATDHPPCQPAGGVLPTFIPTFQPYPHNMNPYTTEKNYFPHASSYHPLLQRPVCCEIQHCVEKHHVDPSGHYGEMQHRMPGEWIPNNLNEMNMGAEWNRMKHEYKATACSIHGLHWMPKTFHQNYYY